MENAQLSCATKTRARQELALALRHSKRTRFNPTLWRVLSENRSPLFGTPLSYARARKRKTGSHFSCVRFNRRYRARPRSVARLIGKPFPTFSDARARAITAMIRRSAERARFRACRTAGRKTASHCCSPTSSPRRSNKTHLASSSIARGSRAPSSAQTCALRVAHDVACA